MIFTYYRSFSTGSKFLLKESVSNDLNKNLDRKNSISMVNLDNDERENTEQLNNDDSDSSVSREDIDAKISNNYHDGVLHLEDSIERLRQLLEEKKDIDVQGYSRSMSDPSKDVKKIDYDKMVLRTYSETDENDTTDSLQPTKEIENKNCHVSFIKPKSSKVAKLKDENHVFWDVNSSHMIP